MQTEGNKLIEYSVLYGVKPNDLSRMTELSLKEAEEILTKRDYAFVSKNTGHVMTFMFMTDTEAVIRNRVIEQDHPYHWVRVVNGS